MVFIGLKKAFDRDGFASDRIAKNEYGERKVWNYVPSCAYHQRYMSLTLLFIENNLTLILSKM